ncbi:MAG: serine/threonine protein kinase, partial [Bacteroidia bacterium]|nr:serine/threonine protein kinase [Bacteroidia bacterium]
MLFDNRYEYDSLTDKLGEGGFGKVFRAYDTLQKRYVALKFADTLKSQIIPGMERYSLVAEINRVIDIVHPNLLRYYHAQQTEYLNNDGEPIERQVGIMEYINGGNLNAYTGNASTLNQKREILKGILSGLTELHRNRIIHRDIKPANILLKKEEDGSLTAKVADFGISKTFSSDNTHSQLSGIIGTYEYMSPEQLITNGNISPQSDIWAIGVLMYQLFTGTPPFGSRKSGTSDAQIIQNIINPGYVLPEPIASVPPPFQNIIRKCLQRDLSLRYKNTTDILRDLEGPEITLQPRTQPEAIKTNPAPKPKVPKQEVTVSKSQPLEVSGPKAGKNANKTFWIAGAMIVGILLIVIQFQIGKSNQASEKDRIQDSVTRAERAVFVADSSMKAGRTKAVADSMEAIARAKEGKETASVQLPEKPKLEQVSVNRDKIGTKEKNIPQTPPEPDRDKIAY